MMLRYNSPAYLVHKFQKSMYKFIYFDPHFDSGWKMKGFELSHDSKSDTTSYMLPTNLTSRATKQYLKLSGKAKKTNNISKSFPLPSNPFEWESHLE